MVWLTAVIIYLVVISRKEGKDATVSRPEGPLSSQGCGAVAVTATAQHARGFALRAGQVHRPEREHDLPAHRPEWALPPAPHRHDRAAGRRPPVNPDAAAPARGRGGR